MSNEYRLRTQNVANSPYIADIACGKVYVEYRIRITKGNCLEQNRHPKLFPS